MRSTPPNLKEFELRPRTGLLYGPDSIRHVPRLLRDLGAESVLIVTDPGIVEAGHAERLRKILEAESFEIILCSKVEQNPSTRCVRECVRSVERQDIDALVALGGGSSIDAAKGCNFLLTNGGEMRDYRGIGKVARPLKPMIAIPTTAGTGSEVQSFALISDEHTHEKMACGDPGAAPRVAVLDPVLTLTQPTQVTACTGIDTIAHAVETAVTRKRNLISLMYSHRAFRLAVRAFPAVLDNPNDLEARGEMLMAAALAGTAIENSMLGAAHSAANPLTARFEVIHGQAVGTMLPWVVRYNARQPDALAGYLELSQAAGLVDGGTDAQEAVERLIRFLETSLDRVEFPASLEAFGVDLKAIERLSEEASRQWTANFNPRPVGTAEFFELYESALEGRK